MEKKQLPEEIDAGRLVLRKHKLELAKTMYNYVHQDKTRLARFLPWVPFIVEVADEEKYIRSTHEKWEACTFFDYGLFRKEDQRYMGNVGVHHIDWENEHCELGYWILGDFEGQGYITEAVLALEKACFALGFHRLQIRCEPGNQRSASVPKRCGYTQEGLIRGGEKTPNGHFLDFIIFGKIISD